MFCLIHTVISVIILCRLTKLVIPSSDGDFFNWIQSISRKKKKHSSKYNKAGHSAKAPFARLSTHFCSSVSMIAPDNNHACSIRGVIFSVVTRSSYQYLFFLCHIEFIHHLFFIHFFQVGFLHLYRTLLMLLFSYRITNYHSTYCPGMPFMPCNAKIIITTF